ncbi:MAG: hypothetical protein WCC57_14420, partial [Paracoccaceae bacterium]
AAVRDADWARLVPAAGADAFAKADLVLVAGDGALAAVALATPPGVVLALIGPGGGSLGAREADVVGLYLVPQSRLAEVIVGPATEAVAVATVVALARKLGRVVVRAKAPGGIGTRVMAAGRAAAMHLAGAGYGQQEVARALGEFGLVGLMGAVSGGKAAFGGKAGPDDAAIVARVMAAMANEGARVVQSGLALRPLDVDLALILGHGFPRWVGGPMHWADQRSLLLLRRDLREWTEEAPEIWAVAPLIDGLISAGRGFGDLNAG